MQPDRLALISHFQSMLDIFRRHSWHRLTYARTPDHRPCHYDTFTADSFDLTGCIYRAAVGDPPCRPLDPDLFECAYATLSNAVISTGSPCTLEEWNDCRARSIDDAIALIYRALSFVRSGTFSGGIAVPSDIHATWPLLSPTPDTTDTPTNDT